MLLQTADRAAAIDAVDEAFARALERWPRVRKMESPVGWTWTVARNLVRTGARRAAREREVLSVAAEPWDVPDVTVEVWDAIRRLAPRAQELIALRYLAGLSERDIAATLGLAAGTVARGLHDARERLRPILQDNSAEETL